MDVSCSGPSQLDSSRANSIFFYSKERAEPQKWTHGGVQDPPLGVSDNRACHPACDSDDAVPRPVLHVLALERLRLTACL